MTDFLVKLMMYDDVYCKTVVSTTGLVTHPDTLVPRALSEMAHDGGFRFEVERLGTMDEIRTFLAQL